MLLEEEREGAHQLGKKARSAVTGARRERGGMGEGGASTVIGGQRERMGANPFILILICENYFLVTLIMNKFSDEKKEYRSDITEPPNYKSRILHVIINLEEEINSSYFL